LIGFLIALPYFGILNSSIGGGQTVGKRALRLRVVHPMAGSLRSTVVSPLHDHCLPYFANGLALPASRTPVAVSTFLSIPDFRRRRRGRLPYLFNRPTRRSLHDLLVGSTVVRDRAKAARWFRSGRVTWRSRRVIVGLVALTASSPKDGGTHFDMQGC